MTTAALWAQAIAFECGDNDQPALARVLNHIRNATIEGGFVSRGRITRGLKEAYGPFHLDESKLTSAIDEAIELLLLSGDVDEFHTSAGRAYAATPPRRI